MGLLNIGFVNWSDGHVDNRNLHVLEEFKKGLEGSEGRCLHANAIRVLVDILVKQIVHVALNFLDTSIDLLLII